MGKNKYKNNSRPSKSQFRTDKERINDLEKELKGLKTKEKKRNRRNKVGFYSGVGGAAAAAAGTVGFLGDSIKGIGKTIGSTLDAVRTANAIMDLGATRDDKLINQYLEKIPKSTRTAYKNADSQGYFSRVTRATKNALETMSRGSRDFPGNNSKPVMGLRKARNWIIEKTKAPFESEKSKGETKIRNTEHYSNNYDELAGLKKNAYAKRNEIKDEMARIARTAEINSKKGKTQAANNGVKKFEKLAKTYTQVSNKFINNIENMGVRKINNDAVVAQTIKDARSYEIERESFDNYGTGALIAGTLGAAAIGYVAGKKLGKLGYSVAKPVAYGAKGAYKGSKAAAKASWKGAKYLGKKASGLVNKFKNRKK